MPKLFPNSYFLATIKKGAIRTNVTLSARPHLLVIWRACLVFATLVLATLTSLALRPGTTFWWVATLILSAGFLFCYLFYLPARQRGLSLTLKEGNLVLVSGVFSLTTRTVPLGSVQYLRVKSSPLHKWLNLRTLEVVCAGGRVVMPGLDAEEAEVLVEMILPVDS